MGKYSEAKCQLCTYVYTRWLKKVNSVNVTKCTIADYKDHTKLFGSLMHTLFIDYCNCTSLSVLLCAVLVDIYVELFHTDVFVR